jgi:hypothetical protein
MNCSDPLRRSAVPEQRVLEDILADIRLRFYATQPREHFHRDRRMLLYALSWPATWLERRGLSCSAQRYRTLIAQRLDAIRAHGDPQCYGDYFPRYLLKCLQDFFERHGDELDGELKHIRNALDQILASARFAARVQAGARNIDTLAAVHRLLHAQRARRVAPDSSQLDLF